MNVQQQEQQPDPKLTPANLSTPETARDDFMRQGYALVPAVLDQDTVLQLVRLIDRHSGGDGASGKRKPSKKQSRHTVIRRLFELDPALCLQVFKNSTVLPIVQRLLGCCGSARGKGDSCLTTHLIHNNAYRIDPGQRGQAPTWHTDDAPTFLTHDGSPLPDSVRMAPLVLTCMYFLNDLNTPGHGGTRVIAGSHRFGKACSNDVVQAEGRPISYAQCPAGSVLIISSHTWHCGAPVSADCPASRYVFQATYGRRLIGHKHDSIMNYQLPKAVEKALDTEEDRKLIGFLKGGAYS